MKLQVLYNNMASVLFQKNIFVDEAVVLLSKRFKQYFTEESIYVIALFLFPIYRDLAISKHYSFDFVRKEIIRIAILWKWTKAECIQLNQDLQR